LFGSQPWQDALIDADRLVELWIKHFEKLEDADRQRLPLKPVWSAASPSPSWPATALLPTPGRSPPRSGLPPFIVGVVLVSIGTDLPELASSIAAHAEGEGDVNVGDSVGVYPHPVRSSSVSFRSSRFTVSALGALASCRLRLRRGQRVADLSELRQGGRAGRKVGLEVFCVREGFRTPKPGKRSMGGRVLFSCGVACSAP
jgi:hypothetical protein